MLDAGLTSGDIDRLGRKLRAAPEEIRKELTKGLRGPIRAIAARQRAAARDLIGDPGVPTEWARQAARDIRADMVLTGPRQPASTRVRRSSVGRGPWHLNKGDWTHPLYGNRQRLYAQRITRKRWFDDTGEEMHGQTITAMEAELDRAAERLARDLES